MGIVANADGSVTVSFDLVDGGGSGISRARVVAVREAAAGSRDQKTGVLGATQSGLDVVVSADLSGNTGAGRTLTFTPGQLLYYERYFFYLACQDAQGWYDAPPGSTTAIETPGQATGAAISNNGGLVYDPFKPALTINSVKANLDGTLGVNYTLAESGNSGLAGAKIVASTSSSFNRQSVLNSSAASGSVADVWAGGTSLSVTATVTLTGLARWTPYYVYGAARDGQGWYDSDSSSPGDGPANATRHPIGNNGGRTWDDAAPSISVTEQPVFTGADNRVRVRYTLVDGGNSGIGKAVVHMRETSGNDAVHQSVILDGSGIGVRKSVGPGVNQYVYFESSELKEYTHYRVYVAARDNQGNYNGSLATQDGLGAPVGNSLPVHQAGFQLARSNTKDLTPPTVSLPAGSLATPASGNDGATVIISWTGAGDASPGSGSASGLKKVWIMATTSSSAFDAATVSGQLNADAQRRFASSASASGSATISNLQAGAVVYGWAVAEDNDGNYSQPSRTQPASITLDNEPPSVSIVSARQDDFYMNFVVRANDFVTGVASLKWSAAPGNAPDPTSGGTVVPPVNGDTNGDTTIRVSKSAYGVGDYETWYFSVVAVDGAGNASGTVSTSIRSWDKSGPSVSAPTVSVAADNRITVSYSASSSGSPISSIQFSFTRDGSAAAVGGLLGSHSLTNANSVSGSKNSSQLAPGIWTARYTVYDYNDPAYGIASPNSNAAMSPTTTFTVYAMPSVSLGSTTTTSFGITVEGISYSPHDVDRRIYASSSPGQASAAHVQGRGTPISGSFATLTQHDAGANMQPGVTYYITAMAENRSGARAFATTSATLQPAAPAATVGVNAAGSDTIDVSWTATAQGGAVYAKIGTSQFSSAGQIVSGGAVISGATGAAGSSGTHTFTGLQAGTAYYVGVAATNSAGAQAFSQASSTTAPYSISASVTTTDVTSNGGNDGTFVITYDVGGGNNTGTYHITKNGTATHWGTLTGSPFTVWVVPAGTYVVSVTGTQASNSDTDAVTVSGVTVGEPAVPVTVSWDQSLQEYVAQYNYTYVTSFNARVTNGTPTHIDFSMFYLANDTLPSYWVVYMKMYATRQSGAPSASSIVSDVDSTQSNIDSSKTIAAKSLDYPASYQYQLAGQFSANVWSLKSKRSAFFDPAMSKQYISNTSYLNIPYTPKNMRVWGYATVVRGDGSLSNVVERQISVS